MRQKNNTLAFIDFLFILLLTFVSMLILVMLIVNPPTRQSDIEVKAEFLIILDWDAESRTDLDLRVRDPLGNTVSFLVKESGHMHLDRDDLGANTDMITLESGETISTPYNREVVSLRGWIPGEYAVTVHAYRKIEGEKVVATVQLIKVTPYQVLLTQGLEFEIRGQEQTVFRFTLDEKGGMISHNRLAISLLEVVRNDIP